MSFLSGIFLWALPLAAAPVIIHLLHRRRRLTIQWGAMRFLQDAATRRRRMWRIEDLLLMLLRAALVALFVLVLARPLISSAGGGAGPRDVIVVLDTSMSTALRSGGEPVFARQLARCGRLLDELGEGDFVRVLLASSAPKWLATAPIPVNDASRDELRGRLGKLSPSLGAADMLRCVREAIAADSAVERADRVVVVVTDGQANSWRPEAAKAWRSLAAEAKAMDVPCAVNVADVGPRDRRTRNLAVESITASRYVTAPGRPITLAAKVANTGDTPIEAMLATFSAGGEALGAVSAVATDPGESTTVKIEHVFNEAGVFEIACTLQANDDLPLDDAGRCVVEVVTEIPILVAAGDVTLDPADTDVGYLLAALGYKGQDKPGSHASVFSPTLIASADLAKERLDDYRCVVLANAGPLGPEVVVRLAEYVRTGGGLWFALGHRTDVPWFNNVIHAGGRGLSPLAVGEAVGDEDDRDNFAVVHAPSPHHPAARLLADTQRLDIDRSQVFRRFALRRGNARDVSVLLATGVGEPVSVERAYGDGRVIVQAVPLGLRWSNLPLLQAYVALAREALWYLSTPSLNHWNVQVGEPLTVALRPGAGGAAKAAGKITARVVAPGGVTVSVAAVSARGRVVVRYPPATAPGMHKLEVSAPGWKLSAPFHVRPDAEESDLALLTEADKKTLRAAAHMAFGPEMLQTAPKGYAAGVGKPAWVQLLWWLLAAMLVELILAAAINRKRDAPAPPVSMEGARQ